MLSGFVGSMPVAGPTAALVVARALEQRLREAWFVALGSALPEGLYAFLACWGISAALERFPAVLGVSRVVGGVLLAGVGVWLLGRAARRGTARPRDPGGRAAVLGLTMTVANPTLIVSWSAAVGVLHSVGALPDGTRSAFPFAAGVSAGVAGWFAVMLRLLSRLSGSVRGAIYVAVVRAVGVAFVAGGVATAVRAVTR